jgi:hypothetical protein
METREIKEIHDGLCLSKWGLDCDCVAIVQDSEGE